MSEYAINQYLGVAEKIVQYGGTKKETAIKVGQLHKYSSKELPTDCDKRFQEY